MTDETKVSRLNAGASYKDGELSLVFAPEGTVLASDVVECLPLCWGTDVEKLEADLARVTAERDEAFKVVCDRGGEHGELRARHMLLEEENALLRDLVGRRVDNCRIAGRDAVTVLRRELCNFEVYVEELEDGYHKALKQEASDE